MKIRLLILLTLSVLFTSCYNNPKYSLSKSDLNLEITKSEPDPNLTFNAFVHRPDVENKIYNIVNIAESLYLPMDIVIGHKSNSTENRNVWWRDEFEGIRLPYSITKSAVNYYVNLIESFRKGEFEENGVHPQDSASFQYVVEIEKKLTFERDGYVFKDKKNLYVIKLTLKWESYCGDLCAINFEKERIVVISNSGEVRAVFGDGPADTVVS